MIGICDVGAMSPPPTTRHAWFSTRQGSGVHGSSVQPPVPSSWKPAAQAQLWPWPAAVQTVLWAWVHGLGVQGSVVQPPSPSG
ncbi:MAG: hypothetical protein HY906_13630 [Deltaproteobacteria bacterium]|nr:hypothetical protein [Deltaproteobacteria bacterium]